MKKVLIIAPYPAYQSPSQRYRFEHFLTQFKTNNLCYDYHSFLDEKTWAILYKKGYTLSKLKGTLVGFIKRFILLFSVSKYDFIFIHREATPVGPPFFEYIIARVFKKKIIYDFDDAIWMLPFKTNKFISFIKWNSKVSFLCKIAHHITVGNDYLAAFATQFNKNVSIIPTVVNTNGTHSLQKKYLVENTVNIGWTGTFSTLIHLEQILPTLKKIEETFNFKLIVICNKRPDFDFNDIEYIEWCKESEAEDLLKIDIGIMPLTNDEWAKGKCGFKAIQYMAMGIPAVVSNVGVNSQIVDHGINGFLCENENDWYEYLLQLLTQHKLRIELGENAQFKIKNFYSVESQIVNFFKIFNFTNIK